MNGSMPRMSKSEFMRSLRKDAFEALQKENPNASRQLLKKGSLILARDWYRKIRTGEIQFGVKVDGTELPERLIGLGSSDKIIAQKLAAVGRGGFRSAHRRRGQH